MRYVEAAGIRVSAIGLGTWQFGTSDWGYGRDYAARIAPALVRRAIERNATPGAAVAAPPGPSAQDMAAAGQMKEEDRNQMIRGMVARLADKLKQDGSDIDGWERLLRAYMVLGERDKAHDAAADARKALSQDPDKLRRLDEVIKGLGVQG